MPEPRSDQADAAPGASAGEANRLSLLQRTLVALLIVVHISCGAHAAWVQTVTHDEIWHLPVGLLTWRTGRFDFDVLNPPLTRVWAAIPVALAGVSADDGVDATDIANQFVDTHDDYHRWYVAGRLMNLLLSVATGLFLCRWATVWFGGMGGVIAAALYFTCPNLIAHGSLVTPDLGLSLGWLLTLWLLSRWRQRGSMSYAAAIGLVLGLTQATKFTAILLYPWVGLFGLLTAFSGGQSDRRWRWLSSRAVVVLLVSLFAWNAAYLFRGTGASLAELAPQSSSLQRLRDSHPWLGNCPLPLPIDYLRGLDRQRAVMEQQHPIFLNDRWSVTGFPDYFLRTLQYKLPHILQVLSLVGLLILLLSGRTERPAGRLLILFGPALSLLVVASGSSMQLGVRYILPVLPVLMLLAAALGPRLEHRPRSVKWPLTAVLLMICGMSLRYQPHHIAYFNELAGGPVGGRHHLLDSNLDWGQDLYLVREFMDAHQLQKIGLVYFGTLPPRRLGIDYEISPGFRPQPGWHAVSVNYVMGRPHLLREPDDTMRPADLQEFAYFRVFEPAARLGGSIDVYHIPEFGPTR